MKTPLVKDLVYTADIIACSTLWPVEPQRRTCCRQRSWLRAGSAVAHAETSTCVGLDAVWRDRVTEAVA
jgi:hypothetical protein